MKKKLLTLPIIGISIITLTSCNFINNMAGISSTTSTTNDTSSSTNVASSTTTSSNTTTTSTTAPQPTTTSTTTSTSTPALSSSSKITTTSTPVATSSSSSTTTSINTTTSTTTSRPTSTSTITSTSTSTSKTSKTSTSTTSYSSASEVNNGINITEVVGYNEAAYLKFEATSTSYNAYYKKVEASTFTKIDNELIRVNGDEGRVDVLGLNPGAYVIKIENANNTSINTISKSFVVVQQDRSGYAHFNYNKGVGAYKDDGTLKNNAVVVYVNENNKNTVTADIAGTKYTGLANILKNATDENYPVDIRILGTIGAATWRQDSPSVSIYDVATTSTIKGINGQYLSLKNYTEDEIIEGGYNELDTSTYSKLNGLTNKIKYDSSKTEFDSYYNMMDISGAKNVTVEGVGEDAEIFQWGLTWKSNCNSIEIKNLTFDDYTEDACSFEGSGTDGNLTTVSAFTSTRYWIHNNTFNRGVNNWDVCSEQDKHDGDGATDFKRVAYVTVAYNEYYNNHKTGLVGGGDTQMDSSITFHHNFYNECQSRLPFARQANMHMYNNYYYGSTGNNMQIYAGAYAFIENCYFKNTKNTFIISSRDLGLAAVKSYNNIYDGATNYSGATIVNSRTDVVNNDNVFGKTFDTNSSLFYYNTDNNISDVSLMLETELVPTLVPLYAGAGHLVAIDYSKNTMEENDPYVDNNTYAEYTTLANPSEEGFYYQALKNIDDVIQIIPESDMSDKISVSLSEDKVLSITDTSDTETAVGFYILNDNQVYSTDTHKYTFDVTLTGVGSKWNFARFLDNNGLEVLAIRVSSNNKYISYTLNGDDTTETIITNTAFKSGNYSISLEVNYSTNTATLKINSYTDTITSFNKQIKGLKFMTAVKAADRSFTVKNIKIDNQEV